MLVRTFEKTPLIIFVVKVNLIFNYKFAPSSLSSVAG